MDFATDRRHMQSLKERVLPSKIFGFHKKDDKKAYAIKKKGGAQTPLLVSVILLTILEEKAFN